jgi:phosphoglycerol transferase MdoB-like AlkP superfamily enzyme
MTTLIKKIFIPRNRAHQFAPAGLMFLCIVYGEVIKMPLVEKLTTMGIGNDEINFGFLALKHDLAIFAGMSILFMLSLMMRVYIVASVIRCVGVLLILFWALDIFVMKFFTTRLTVGDLIKFSGQWNSINSFIRQLFPNQQWVLVILIASIGVLIILFVFTKIQPLNMQTIIVFSILPLGLSSTYITDDQTTYVHAWTYQNILEVNVKQGIAKEFSDEHIKALDKSTNSLDKRDVCIPGKGETPNVIVLLFESLSMYHSHTFSGLSSMVPNFDRIANENISYTNFHSNGFTTEAAMVSIFTGKHMFPPVKGYAAASWDSGFFYQGFHETKGSLPELFNDNGYYTSFMTTGNLAFLGKGLWLRKIGFDTIEGAEEPFYEGWPRLHFGAAPDKALYKRFFDLLPVLENKAPYMLVIETVSTHQPFLNPHNSARDEASVFSMADEALGIFYDTLKTTDFFTNGILVILGDHRSMTGLRQEELALYGRAAASRVPMAIVYGDSREPKKVSSFSQQTDFIPSFEYLIGKQSCTGSLNGNFFIEPAIEAEYILFPRGDDRNLVDVYTKTNHDVTVHIKGDETSFKRGEVNGANDIIRHINKERLRISRTREKAHRE